MIVADLIGALSRMPDLGAEVFYIWDGVARSPVDYLWVARNGGVMISDGGYVANTKHRPQDAPTREQEMHWCPDGEDLP